MSETGHAGLIAPPTGPSSPPKPTAGGPDFPGQSLLPVTANWWTSVMVGLGASLMIAVSLWEMAVEIGNISIWVWIAAAAIGALQSMMIAEMASRFPNRAGGTAQFAYRATPKGSHTLGALSSWSYWFAWTPGIAVNLIMAADYLESLIWPGANIILVACLIAAVLYFVVALGLRLTAIVNAALVTVALAVVLIIVLTPVLKPGSFDFGNILPAMLPEEAPTDTWGQIGVIAKWAFLACWAGYAAEMASTVVAEIREPERHMKKIMSVSAINCLVAFTLVPVSLFGVAGVLGVQRDPFELFGDVGAMIFGPAGELIAGLGLATVLILGALIFIIGSSRTIYQMSQDGYLPRFFSRTNRRGAPVGSIAFDAAVILLMLVVFGTDVVQVVAAATFGYVTVFVLLPLAYLRLRGYSGGNQNGFRLNGAFKAVAVALVLYNGFLLVFGGLQWGADVIAVGLGATLSILPISYLTRKLRARNP